ncbi:MAG: hypothetical protein AAB404_00880 [Patescibacteria group bacterium]
MELEEELGKSFIRDEELTSGAIGHCKAMVERGCCYNAPKYLLGSALAEAVDGVKADYQDLAIKQAVKKMAIRLIESREYHGALRFYPVIGVSIAVKDIWSGEVALYATLRLKK